MIVMKLFFTDYRENVNEHNGEGIPILTVIEKSHGELSQIITNKVHTYYK